MYKCIISCIILFLTASCILHAEDNICNYLWNNAGNISADKAAVFYKDHNNRGDLEGVWKTKNLTFLILKAPDNDCKIYYRIITFDEKNTFYKLRRAYSVGDVIGLVGKQIDSHTWICYYKTRKLSKPRMLLLQFNESGTNIIKLSCGNRVKIIAEKIYPYFKESSVSVDTITPINRPIPRN